MKRRAPAAFTREGWDRDAVGWERWELVLMHGLGSVDAPLLRALALEPGQRVLDFACGTGDPAIAIAQWVGPRGRVVAQDLSAGMLAAAQRRARPLKLPQLRFRRGDMDRLRLGAARFDRAVARYGLMFATDPVATLRAIARAVKPGGRVVVAVWGKNNPGPALRAEALRPLLETPPANDPNTLNPGRFARPGSAERMFEQAGYRKIESEVVAVSTTYPSLDDLVALLRDTSMREAFAALAPDGRRRLASRLRRLFRRYVDGPLVRVPGEARVISGVRPG